jgi:hypothetical protein
LVVGRGRKCPLRGARTFAPSRGDVMASTHDRRRATETNRRLVLRKIERPTGLPVVAPPAAAPPRRAEPEYVEELDVVLEAESVDQAPAPRHAPMATPEPPPPATAYGSLPPVAASAPPPRPERSSSMRGVVFGSLLGLAIVAAFVAGARLAQRPASGQATQSAPLVAEPSPPPTAPVHEEPVAMQVPSPPSAPDPIVASVVSVAPGPRHARAKAHTATTQSPAPSATAVVAPSDVEPPIPTAVEPSAPTAVASASAPAPDDTGPSLVPVIPPSTPAEGDPLVKAVQKDIAEDPTRGRH